jgi:hypothetical protein
MSDEHVAFRPRYSADESSNEAYEEDLRQQHFQRKKRRVYAVVILIIGFIAVTVIFRIYNFVAGITGGAFDGGSDKQNSVAKKESFGLFDDIPNNIWKQKKAASKKAVELQDKMIAKTSDMLSESGADIDERKWWQQNWLPNFSCDNELLIGGKWICNPSRIIDLADEHKDMSRKQKKQRGRKECLIYVTGGNDMEFGHQFSTYSETRMAELHSDESGVDLSICEIHIFNHFIDHAVLANTATQQVNGVHVHPFGFRPENKESMGVAGDGSFAFKTLKETVEELGHAGKKLAILAIDCEGCEWDIYREMLSSDLTIQQVLIQMHGTPFIANRFFVAMHNAGYAIFHREEVGRSVYDYSFLKLAPSYFGSTKPQLRLPLNAPER